MNVDLAFQYGTLEVINCSTKHKSVLNFKRSDLLGRDLHKIEGYLYDARFSHEY